MTAAVATVVKVQIGAETQVCADQIIAAAIAHGLQLPTCCICEQRPATHAGECARCFTIGIELDKRCDR